MVLDTPSALIAVIGLHPELTALEIRVLIFVHMNSLQPKAPLKLAETIGASRQAVSRAAKTLGLKGLVRREKDKILPTNLIKVLQDT